MIFLYIMGLVTGFCAGVWYTDDKKECAIVDRHVKPVEHKEEQ